MTQQFVSVPEFASRTSLSARAVWRLIMSNSIPSLRVGSRRLVPLDAAMAAIQRLGTCVTGDEEPGPGDNGGRT